MTAVLRREKPLAREIVLLLVVKLCALTAIWYAFYREPVVPSMIDGMDPAQVTEAVLWQPAKTKVHGSEEPDQTVFR
jgi:hypothetical protein